MIYDEEDSIQVPADILKNYGPVSGILYASILKECTKTGSNCNYSYRKLAQMFNVPLRTVNRKMKQLFDDGLLFDVRDNKNRGTRGVYTVGSDAILALLEYNKKETDAKSDAKNERSDAKLTMPLNIDDKSDAKIDVSNAKPNSTELTEEQKEERFQKNKKMFLEKFYGSKTWDDENDFWLKVLFVRNENSQKKVYASLYEAPKRFNGKEMTEYLIEVMKKYANV